MPITDSKGAKPIDIAIKINYNKFKTDSLYCRKKYYLCRRNWKISRFHNLENFEHQTMQTMLFAKNIKQHDTDSSATHCKSAIDNRYCLRKSTTSLALSNIYYSLWSFPY